LRIEFDGNGVKNNQVEVVFEQMISLASIIKKMKSTSILGKSNLIKSYILSKLWYLAPVLTSPTTNIKKYGTR
jgi:hypothetical protein